MHAANDSTFTLQPVPTVAPTSTDPDPITPTKRTGPSYHRNWGADWSSFALKIAESVESKITFIMKGAVTKPTPTWGWRVIPYQSARPFSSRSRNLCRSRLSEKTDRETVKIDTTSPTHTTGATPDRGARHEPKIPQTKLIPSPFVQASSAGSNP